MSTVLIESPDSATNGAPLVLQLPPYMDMTDDQFFEFCQFNRDLRIERNSQGDISVMSPTGVDAGGDEAEIIIQLGIWAKQDGTGKTYGSSTGFTLPNKAVRSPDASWISYQRLNAVTPEQRKTFAPLCPEFVIELRSPSDRLDDLQGKMEEYVANGVLMGLLIDPKAKRVYVYQPNKPVQELEGCEKVSCEPVLPGFELVVKEIW